ncbi:hypothetical protein TRIP_E50154 [uncultured Spirochaetota bacterium]|nr:hypothetical protein TRIP_E50154 [uncultured Spirochaetota bacterium]
MSSLNHIEKYLHNTAHVTRAYELCKIVKKRTAHEERSREMMQTVGYGFTIDRFPCLASPCQVMGRLHHFPRILQRYLCFCFRMFG